MIYTLTFTKDRRPYTENGQVVKKQVEADSKQAAMVHPDVVKFGEEKGCSIRSVEKCPQQAT